MISEDDEEGWAGTAAIFVITYGRRSQRALGNVEAIAAQRGRMFRPLITPAASAALLIQLERADGHDPPQQISPFITALDDRFKLC